MSNKNINIRNNLIVNYMTPSDKDTPKKALQTISLNQQPASQPNSTTKKRKLFDSDGNDNRAKKPRSTQKRHQKNLRVYQDKPIVKKSHGTQSIQTDIRTYTHRSDCKCCCFDVKPEVELRETPKTEAEKTIEMITSEKPNEEYWEKIAEKRREALEETLIENKELHGKIEELTEENASLSEMAKQADYFASVLKEITGDDSIIEGGGDATDDHAGDGQEEQPSTSQMSASNEDSNHSNGDNNNSDIDDNTSDDNNNYSRENLNDFRDIPSSDAE